MTAALTKTSREIALMAESCAIVGDVLRFLRPLVRPGVSTLELDRAAEEFIRAQGGVPAFKGYGTDRRNLFPGSRPLRPACRRTTRWTSRSATWPPWNAGRARRGGKGSPASWRSTRRRWRRSTRRSVPPPRRSPGRNACWPRSRPRQAWGRSPSKGGMLDKPHLRQAERILAGRRRG